MRVRHSIGTAVVFAIAGIAAGFAGCASQGNRGARRGEGIATRLGDRAAASQSAAGFSDRHSTGASALPRLARLNKDSMSLSDLEALSRPAPPPVGQYGPVGDYGIAPPPYWPPDPYGSGYPYVGPGGYAVGGVAHGPYRVPHDPGEDTTGLAGAVHGASAYRNPGEDDRTAHRPGTSSGNGPFEKTLEAERRAEEPPPAPHGHGRNGR